MFRTLWHSNFKPWLPMFVYFCKKVSVISYHWQRQMEGNRCSSMPTLTFEYWLWTRSQTSFSFSTLICLPATFLHLGPVLAPHVFTSPVWPLCLQPPAWEAALLEAECAWAAWWRSKQGRGGKGLFPHSQLPLLHRGTSHPAGQDAPLLLVILVTAQMPRKYSPFPLSSAKTV